MTECQRRFVNTPQTCQLNFLKTFAQRNDVVQICTSDRKTKINCLRVLIKLIPILRVTRDDILTLGIEATPNYISVRAHDRMVFTHVPHIEFDGSHELDVILDQINLQTPLSLRWP
jgi:hypothetical protein